VISGIMGMTKSAMAFMATPFGAALTIISALLSPIIEYLTNTQEGIDAVTTVTRPLQSVFQALSGVFQQVGKFLFEAFTNPKKSMQELYEFVKQNLINRFTAFGTILEGIMTMDFKKISNGVLQAATGVEDVIGKTQKAAQATGQFFDEAVKRGQMIDGLQKQLDRGQAAYTKRTSELSTEMDRQKGIADDTNLSHAQRERAAIKAIELAKEQNRLAIARMDTEIRLAKLKMQENGFTNEENKQLAEMTAKRNEVYAGHEASEKSLQGKLNGIRQDAATKEKARQQQKIADAIETQKLELELLLTKQGIEGEAMQSELALAQDVADRKRKIAEAEFNASKKTANDKLKLDIANAGIAKDLAEAQKNAAVQNAETEMEAIRQKNLLNQANADTQAELESQRAEAKIAADAIDLENKRLADTANYDYNYALQEERLNAQEALELAAAEKTGANKDLIEKKYAQMRKDTEAAVMNNKLGLASSTFGNLAAIMGKESAAGKAIAVAQATIDTYKSAVSAYSAMSGIAIVGPAGGASAPNYFAGGGIVSREIAQQSLNTDELALKIAEANRTLPPPVVAVQDIITEGNSYVRVRDAANFK
jgi:hypothetical protein